MELNELNEQEQYESEKYRSEEIDKVKSSNLDDETKKDKLEYLKSMEFHKVTPMRVKEVAPHQWEAY